MQNEIKAFCAGILASPDDVSLKSVFCDWLEENNDYWLGTEIRKCLLGKISSDMQLCVLLYTKEILKLSHEAFESLGGSIWQGNFQVTTPILYGRRKQQHYISNFGFLHAISCHFDQEKNPNKILIWHAWSNKKIDVPLWGTFHTWKLMERLFNERLH